jgi:hypothetical protein
MRSKPIIIGCAFTGAEASQDAHRRKSLLDIREQPVLRRMKEENQQF